MNARLASAGVAALLCGTTVAQTPARSAPPQAPARGATAPATARGAVPVTTRNVDANLLQLMRGIVYPSSNVIFAAQGDLTKIPPATDPATSPNPLSSTYGGWEAVQNAALALAESATLVAIPARQCANGKPVPVQRAEWVKFVQGLAT